MMKTKNLMVAALVGAMFAAAPSANAGLLKDLKEKAMDVLVKTDAAMRNTNKNYWGEGGLGDTVTKSVKGMLATTPTVKWHEAFDNVHGAQVAAQNGALADVKALGKAMYDLLMVIPRWLHAQFKKLMDKIAEFIHTLDRMNQGDTPAERLGNLVNPPPAGGGEAPAKEGDAENPAAPLASASFPEMDGVFSGMLEITGKVEDDQDRGMARKTVRGAFLTCLDKTLATGSRKAAAILMRESADFYSLDAEGMHEAVSEVASRHPGALADDYVKVSGRLEKAARLQRRSR